VRQVEAPSYSGDGSPSIRSNSTNVATCPTAKEPDGERPAACRNEPAHPWWASSNRGSWTWRFPSTVAFILGSHVRSDTADAGIDSDGKNRHRSNNDEDRDLEPRWFAQTRTRLENLVLRDRMGVVAAPSGPKDARAAAILRKPLWMEVEFPPRLSQWGS